MKKLIVIIAALLAACDDTPPPIAGGKCLADVYEGENAREQICTYVGYEWRCRLTDGVYTCVRIGEAKGER